MTLNTNILIKAATRPLRLVSALAFIALFNTALAVNALDTQYGQDGIEVHLLKVKVANNVLTASFMFENSSDQEIRLQSLVIGSANYTTSDKKYPVLKDANGKWLASTITYEPRTSTTTLFTSKESAYKYHYVDLKAGAKRVGWVKFEAPADEEWPIELTLPGVSPFSIEKPE